MEEATLHKTLQGHTRQVNAVAFSPDSKLLASASLDKTVYSVAFSPDGKSIVTGSADHTVRTWSIATKKQVKTLKGHSNEVNSVAWSPTGELIASGSDDKTVIFWDVTSGSAKKKQTGHTDRVYSVSFSRNGKKLASAGWVAIIWDVNSGAALIKLANSYLVYSVCFSPDDQFVVTGGFDRIVHMFNANDGREEKRFDCYSDYWGYTDYASTGHTDTVYSVAISFDGSMIASGSKDKSVWLWDVASTKRVQQLDGHTDIVTSVAFSRDCEFIASGSADRTVCLWERDSVVECFYR